MMKKILYIITALLIISGCRVRQPVIQESGFYYTNPQAGLDTVRKLVILEFKNNTNFSTVESPLTRQLQTMLTKRHLFEISYISSDSSLWKQLSESDINSMDSHEIRRYCDILNADAILTGEITEYRPFPSPLISVKSQMVDLRSGQIMWSLEQVWDSIDIGVENRIKRYYEAAVKKGYEPMGWEYIRTSPTAYRQFVTYEIAMTFPSNNYYKKEYLDYQESPKSLRDEFLRPVVRFPKTAKDTVGM